MVTLASRSKGRTALRRNHSSWSGSIFIRIVRRFPYPEREQAKAQTRINNDFIIIIIYVNFKDYNINLSVLQTILEMCCWVQDRVCSRRNLYSMSGGAEAAG